MPQVAPQSAAVVARDVQQTTRALSIAGDRLRRAVERGDRAAAGAELVVLQGLAATLAGDLAAAVTA